MVARTWSAPSLHGEPPRQRQHPHQDEGRAQTLPCMKHAPPHVSLRKRPFTRAARIRKSKAATWLPRPGIYRLVTALRSSKPSDGTRFCIPHSPGTAAHSPARCRIDGAAAARARLDRATEALRMTSRSTCSSGGRGLGAKRSLRGARMGPLGDGGCGVAACTRMGARWAHSSVAGWPLSAEPLCSRVIGCPGAAL